MVSVGHLVHVAFFFIPNPGHARVIDQSLLKILRCPKDLSPLSLANSQLLERVNRVIEAGRIVNLEGVCVQQQLESALISDTGELLYPIINEIPALLPGEAIPLNQLDEPYREKTNA
jgi:uncharacterized protein YbaR (Trm112 family)